MTNTLEFRVGLLLCLSLSAALSGCSNSDKPPGDGGVPDGGGGLAGGGGRTGTGGRVGAGGRASAGGSVGNGGAGGGDPQPAGVTCGATVCESPLFGVSCCTAEGTGQSGHALELAGVEKGQCGSDTGAAVPENAGICLQLNVPGKLTTDCPTVDTGFAVEDGCCTDEGFCGHMNINVPLGCTYLSGPIAVATKGAPCGPAHDGGIRDGGTD
jgi:hypothetical protein